MARLIYSAISSLDGFIEDPDGGFGWAAPDDEVHGFINDLERPVGTYLYGRRMYETMIVWETDPALATENPLTRDFAAIWAAAPHAEEAISYAIPTTCPHIFLAVVTFFKNNCELNISNDRIVLK